MPSLNVYCRRFVCGPFKVTANLETATAEFLGNRFLILEQARPECLAYLLFSMASYRHYH